MANESKPTNPSITPEDHDIFLFMGPVTDEACKDLVAFILVQNTIHPRPKQLKLIRPMPFSLIPVPSEKKLKRLSITNWTICTA